MKFLRLEMSGIGPFGGTELIDFTDLTSSGIFLLEGPTGSGKSTIIDAIVFALYGSVAGADSSKDRMRSTHASPNAESRVDLIFEVSSGIYRVRRVPEWSKPKSRGTGTTNISQQATLWRLSQEAVDSHNWDLAEPLASGPRDVGIELNPIRGLTQQQFVQTVVLPQGQFAEFLRMKSDERSKLLETLFDTSSYRDFATQLQASAKDAAKRISDARAQFNSAVDRWLGIDAVQPFEEEVRALHGEITDPADARVLERMDSENAKLAVEAEEREERAGAARTKAARAAEAFQAAQSLHKALTERAKLIAEKEQLESQNASVELAREQIEKHTAAQTAHSRLKDAQRARTSHIAAASTAADSAATVGEIVDAPGASIASASTALETPNSELGPQQEILGAAASELSGVETELGEQLGSLKSLSKSEERAATLEKNLAQNARDVAKEKDKELKLAAERDALPGQISQFESQLAGHQKVAQTLEPANEKLKKLTERKSLVESLGSARKALDKSAEKLQSALKVHEDRRATVTKTTDRWVRSAAAELAIALEDSVPCPVCGSTEHPTPAVPAEGFASRGDVDKAQALLDKAKNDLDSAQTEYGPLTGRVQSLEAQVGEDTLENITAQVTTTQAEIRAAQAARTDLVKVEERIVTSRARRDKVLNDLSAIASRIASLQATHESESQELAEIRHTLSAAVPEGSTLASLISTVERNRRRVVSARTDLEKARSTAHTLERAEADFATELAKSGHDSAESVEKSILSEKQVAQLKSTITKHESATAKVAGRLDAPDIKELSGEEEPHLEEAKAARNSTAAQSHEADQASAVARRSASDAQRHYESAVARHSDWEAITEDSGAIVRLANIANADSLSLSKIPLNVWVLLRRFEAVLDRANEHLATFSRGRYALARTDEGEKERKTGLGLELIDLNGDTNGDVKRSTRTLSGGETFYTSLSLALALAEVVQEESGGVRIETLLIDEGFGSLSQDVRDIVMQTLTTLTQSGRTVGIVSHVEDLKQMVPNRVEVRPVESGGSTLKVIA